MSKLGNQILDYLLKRNDANLPDYGVIAGQSVAEAYFRVKNIPIYTRVKDIKLFMNLTSNYYRKKYSDYQREIQVGGIAKLRSEDIEKHPITYFKRR